MANYNLTEKEDNLAKAFRDKHKLCRPEPQKGNIFQQYAPYAYIFEPNGIGVAVSIRCPYCGGEEDITDIDSW